MRKRFSGNVVLAELLVVALFFALSSAVLVRLFAAASNMGRETALRERALIETQNWAESLARGGDMDAALRNGDWSVLDGEYVLREDDMWLYATVSKEQTEVGTYYAVDLRAENAAGETLAMLRADRYDPKGGGGS